MSDAPLFSEPLVGELLPPAPSESSDVTLYCDEDKCAESFVGPAGGKGSAPMLLGRHRFAVHGIRKDGSRKAKGAGKVTDAQSIDARHPLVSAVAEVGGKVSGTGTPRAPQLSAALGRGLSIATLMAASWAVDSDPVIREHVVQDPENGAAQKDALTRLLALSEESAAKIAAPVGRLLAPTTLNQKYGRALVDNTDIGPAVAELVDVGRAWVQFLAVRRAHVAELRALRQQQQPAPYVAPTPDAQAAAAQAAGPGPAAGAGTPLGAGRVATPTYRTA